jgi:hypothetical protein
VANQQAAAVLRVFRKVKQYHHYCGFCRVGFLRLVHMNSRVVGFGFFWVIFVIMFWSR